MRDDEGGCFLALVVIVLTFIIVFAIMADKYSKCMEAGGVGTVGRDQICVDDSGRIIIP